MWSSKIKFEMMPRIIWIRKMFFPNFSFFSWFGSGILNRYLRLLWYGIVLRFSKALYWLTGPWQSAAALFLRFGSIVLLPQCSIVLSTRSTNQPRRRKCCRSTPKFALYELLRHLKRTSISIINWDVDNLCDVLVINKVTYTSLEAQKSKKLIRSFDFNSGDFEVIFPQRNFVILLSFSHLTCVF